MGSAFFAKRTHCAMVQSRSTRAKEQNHSFTSQAACASCAALCMAQLARHRQSPAPSPATAGSSPAGATLAISSCTAKCSATAAIVSCTGCTSPPSWWIWSQLFDTTLTAVTATGWAPDTSPSEQETCPVHGATRDWRPLPVDHTANAVSVLHDQRLPCRKHLGRQRLRDHHRRLKSSRKNKQFCHRAEKQSN